MGDITFCFRRQPSPRKLRQTRQRGFYDGLLFHRVIDSFMIRGDPTSKRCTAGKHLGAGDPSYRIDAKSTSPSTSTAEPLPLPAKAVLQTLSQIIGLQVYIVPAKKFSPARSDPDGTKA